MVALGVVIRGGTPHFEYVCRAVTDGLARVALDTGCRSASACSPATTSSRRSTGPDSRGRREDKGREAAEAAVATAVTLRGLAHVVRPVAERFVHAFAQHNRADLLDLLAPEVDFRGMTPGRFWEAGTAEGLVDDVLFQLARRARRRAAGAGARP